MPHKVNEYILKHPVNNRLKVARSTDFWLRRGEAAQAYGHEGIFSRVPTLSELTGSIFKTREEQAGRPTSTKTPAAAPAELPIWQKVLLFMASPVKYFTGSAQIEVEKEGGGFLGSIGKFALIAIGGILLILLVGTFLFFSVKKEAS